MKYFYFILFYFILFYFILFYFILFYFILFYLYFILLHRDLSNNKLVGNIPETLGQLKSLKFLYVSIQNKISLSIL